MSTLAIHNLPHDLRITAPTAKMQDCSNRCRPHFVLAGVSKSATTFVHACLSDHPQVYMPPEETPFFEDPDFQQTSMRDFLALLAPGRGRKALGIKRPEYLSKPEVPRRLHQLAPHAKILVVLRDPIARVISHYHHFMQYGFLPVQPLNQGLAGLMDGKIQARYPRANQVLEESFYHAGLMRYLRYFDPQQMLVLLHEEIESNPQAVMQQVYRFLDVDDRHQPAHLHSRPQAALYSLPRLRWRRLENSLLYSYTGDGMRMNHRLNTRFLNRALVQSIRWVDHRLLKPCLGNAKPVLSPELARRLSDLYRNDAERLQQYLGKSLQHWSLFHVDD